MDCYKIKTLSAFTSLLLETITVCCSICSKCLDFIIKGFRYFLFNYHKVGGFLMLKTLFISLKISYYEKGQWIKFQVKMTYKTL